MPENSYGGAVLRNPQSFAVNFVSTIKPTLLNEARVGLTRTQSSTYDPYYNPVNGDQMKNKLIELYPQSNGIPVVIGLGGQGSYPAISNLFAIAGGTNVWGSGRGNFAATWGGHDPR